MPQFDLLMPSVEAPRAATAGRFSQPALGPGRRTRLLCVGGEDHHLRIPFLHALAAHGFEVHAAANCAADPFSRAGIPLHDYAFTRRLDPLGDLRAVRALGAIIDAVGPDIVQSFDTKPNLYTALVRPERAVPRLVRTINGTGRVHSSGGLGARCLRPVYNAIQRRADRRGAVAVFQNEADQATFAHGGMSDPERAHLILGSGIDVDAIDRARAGLPNPALLREQLELGRARVVITVTRIEPLKGTGTLLAAAELIQAVAPDVRFLLVGPWENAGRRERRLMALCQRSRAVRWIGPRQDVQSLLALADLFVLPTEFREGLPRVLLEAALAGLPIVTTNMPGCMGVVQHGRNGLLVPPRAPGALAVAILELLSAPERAQAMGRQGAALVRDRFSLASIAAQYASLYRTLASPADLDQPMAEPEAR